MAIRWLIWMGVVLGAFVAPASGQPSWARVAPWADVRWGDGDAMEVWHERAWWRLVSIEGFPAAEFVASARQRWPDKAREREAEDVVEVLVGLGWERRDEVDLVLRPLDGGADLRVRGVTLTAEKRGRIGDAAREEAIRRAPLRAEALAAPSFAQLRTMPAAALGVEGPTLTHRQVLEDVAQLEWHLRAQHSYLRLREVDLDALLDALAASRDGPMLVDDFAIAVHKAICLLGDGHARVRDLDEHLPGKMLAARFVDTLDGVHVVVPDGIVFDDWPVHAIDEVPLARWLEAAAAYVPAGSPQLVRHRALALLPRLELLRVEVELTQTVAGVQEALPWPGRAPQDGAAPRPTDAPTMLELARVIDGVQQATLQMRRPLRAPDEVARAPLRWPPTPVGLAEDVAYLRLASMDRDAPRRMRDALVAARGKAILVVDVRGNGGGSRAALLELAPRIIDPAQGPVVANVARYRLAPWFEEDHLANRFLRRADWEGWTAAERTAIERVARAFEPAWEDPASAMSAWHYLVLSPALADDPLRFDGRVLVLQDEECFSATDIFLGAMAEIDGVTLVGTASGGGSGRSQSIELAHSGLRIGLSSMASYRPDGSLFDGAGVAPDLVVERRAQDLTGEHDAQLAAGLAEVRRAR